VAARPAPYAMSFALLSAVLGTVLVQQRIVALNRTDPYADAEWSKQTRDLAKLSPRFGSRLMTSESNYLRVQGLMNVWQRAEREFPGRPVATLPDQPLTYFLLDRRNPLPVDWWVPNEYRPREAWVTQRLREVNPVVILEAAAPCSLSRRDSAIEREVLERMRFRFSEGHFCVYEGRLD
jgi:hypothetical protein